MLHAQRSPLAGQTVLVADHASEIGGLTIAIEDWWDRVAGQSWMFCDGNLACLQYAMRTGLADYQVPTDNEVLYGKVGNAGVLVHLSELSAETTDA